MIAVDTNVLVRYIVQDDKTQAHKANRLIESLTPDDPGFIGTLVLCELNWVLKAVYKIPKPARLSTLENILSVSAFEIENIDLCIKALQAYKTGKADFSDYLIRETAVRAGCVSVVTFDKNALKEKGFSSP